jgi:hypothetical protein
VDQPPNAIRMLVVVGNTGARTRICMHTQIIDQREGLAPDRLHFPG